MITGGEVISPKGINSVLYVDISTSDTLINGYVESNFSFTPLFLRKKSWIGNEIRSNELLEFEQYKSRLVYLYALKMKASVLGKTYDLNSFKDSVFKIYSLLNDELSVALQKYGYDTQTGKDKKKQIAWEEKIDGWIEDYRKL